MYPSVFSTSAIRHFSLVAGISTTGRSMRLALRKRVSISATGSVIMAVFLSPTRFLNAWNQAAAGHVAEANPANTELAIDGTGPAAQAAAHANANSVAGPQLLF